jgi:hypothetical protein
MKGSSIRPAIPAGKQLRVIHDMQDSTRDEFLTFIEAKKYFDREYLKRVYIGRAYPNSYIYKGPPYART